MKPTLDSAIFSNKARLDIWALLGGKKIHDRFQKIGNRNNVNLENGQYWEFRGQRGNRKK